MKKIFIGLSIILLVASCKTSFDTLLTGTDYEMKYNKAFELYEEGEYYKAQLLFEQIMSFYRGTDKVEKIYFHFAYTFYYLNKEMMASYYFKNFTSTFPNSQYVEEAAYMTAFCNYQMSPTYRLDQTYSLQAIDDFQRFVNTYPNSDKVERCNALMDELRYKLEEKAFASAELYYKLSNFQSASHAFSNVLRDYPDSKNAEKVRFMILKSSYKLAENSVEYKQKERYQETIKNCLEFKDRYPNSKYFNEAEEINTISVEKLKKLEL